MIYGCSGLTSVSIPSTITTIGDYAFYGCSEIADVYCLATTMPTTGIMVFSYEVWIDEGNGSGWNDTQNYSRQATLHVPESAINSYLTTEPWRYFGTIEKIVEQCAKPNITFANGKVRFDCETENVKFVPTVTCEPSQTLNGNELELGTTFTISVYAKRRGYADSEVATATINLASIGDVNGDGQITIADVTSLVNIILGK